MPEAPYPADTRAKGWRFELDHERIRQSDTWALAPAELRPWLLMLWMVAWEQTPCGTLPTDDALIAARIGMAPKTFSKHREVLLRAWYEADDGRLYHATMTERVMAMLAKRAKDAKRTRESRARDSNEHDASHGVVTRDTPATHAGVGSEFDTKHQAPSTSTPVKRERAARASRKCPQPFMVTVEMLDWAKENTPTVSVNGETEKFMDHTFKNAITDWPGAWRNWMRKASEFTGRGAVVPINRQEALEQRNRNVGEDWLREQEAMDASR